MDVRVVNLRDEQDASTSNKAGKDDEDEDEEDSLKVQSLPTVFYLFISPQRWYYCLLQFSLPWAAVTIVSVGIGGVVGDSLEKCIPRNVHADTHVICLRQS